jgi:hypothetical protein
MAVMVRFAPVGRGARGSSTEGFAVGVEPDGEAMEALAAAFEPNGEVLVVHPAAKTIATTMLASNTHKTLLSVLIFV